MVAVRFRLATWLDAMESGDIDIAYSRGPDAVRLFVTSGSELEIVGVDRCRYARRHNCVAHPDYGGDGVQRG